MSDEKEEVLYALILERESPKPIQEIGQIVARQLSLASPDTVAQVRYGGGLIAEDLSESRAEALAAALREIDVSVRRVEAEEWLTVPRGYKISTLKFEADTLEAYLSTGRKFVIPTGELFGFHLYGLQPAGSEAPTRKKKKGAAEQAVPLELSSLSPRGRQLLGNMAENEVSEMEFHLTLYGPPSVGPLRLRRGNFNFACLGNDKLNHSLDNFILLLEKLIHSLPHAWNIGTIEEFLSEMDPMRILYFKEEEAENFDRCMLQWVQIEYREGRGGAG